VNVQGSFRARGLQPNAGGRIRHPMGGDDITGLRDDLDRPSWGDGKSQYGAVGDGVADDTAALQRALNDLGRDGKPQVLYLPAGTYKITATLNLTGSQEHGPGVFGWGGVGIIGADPATTTIKWAGPPGQPMLVQNGGLGTRYDRLTWDGSGTAGYGVAHWWNAHGGGLYGGSFEHQDEVFKNMSIGIMGGRLGVNFGELDSEGQIRRVTFINNTYAGLDVGSWNALDWWVWDSHFVDCARGVSNNRSLNDAGPTTGAGAMYVYRSLFEHSSVADMAVGNTGWFSLHNNVSIGSRRFFESTPIGAHAAVVIVQNNRVVQSTDPVPISLGSTGPLLLIDNQIQAARSTYELTDWIQGRDVLSLGNRVTAVPPAALGSDRLLSVDDVSVATESIATQPLALPLTPAVTAHEVYEVLAGATAEQIQALIDQSARSADPQPIIHFGHGTWTLDRTLQIQRGRSVQLVGDGFGSLLSWSGKRQVPC
jgi:Pectate lyase superfamily protein